MRELDFKPMREKFEKLFTGEEKKFLDENGPSIVISSLLNQGLTSMHPQGVSMRTAKILARLQDRLEESSRYQWAFTIEDAEFDILKSVFSDDSARFSPQQCRAVAMISDVVQSAKEVATQLS